MKARVNQSGFSIVAIGLVVVVIGIVGFLGYTFYNSQMNKTTSNDNSQNTQSSTASDVKSAPEINNTSDLDKAATTLDETDPSGSNSTDATQLDEELGNF